jgi:hypothetical protein
MSAWARRNRGDMCDNTLSRMLAAGLRPDPLSCRMLLSAHATSERADSAERTDAALQRYS